MLRAGGGIYDVAVDDGPTLEASIRGRLKLEERTGDRVVAGDRVRVQSHEDGSHTIEAVEPRHSQLARRAPGRGRPRAKVIVANVDQVVLVMAASAPAPNPRMLDRLLVLAESNDLPSVIVVNKVETRPAAEIEAVLAPYRAAGYPTIHTSAIAGTGIETLRQRLCGRDSVLTGPSGVGKSSLLNAVQPGLSLRTGDTSDATGKGRHTTVTARILPLGCGGWVADTPGLREVGLWDIDRAELDAAFPEFRPFLGQCRFGGSCSHTHEPDCAIRAAVEDGEIDRTRYESYVVMLEDED